MVLAISVAAVLASAVPSPGGTLAGEPAREAEDGPLPGLEALALDAKQAVVIEEYARKAYCHCGCPHTVAGCLRRHAECKHAPRTLAMAARLVRAGATLRDVERDLATYHGSFERSRRVKLDLAEFGPPLGATSAPVTLVEVSDFTCPYCRALRPVLEELVGSSGGRVKLHYKPFPIASHARSREAALAAEWARDLGKFWEMHDRLFENPRALSDEDLAAHARALGGDPDDLARAIAEGRHEARVRASQAEARRAGLTGTPTLFIDGRRLNLVVAVEDMADLLRATLEDEEEWRQRERWAKD